jgi:hypothetical protein
MQFPATQSSWLNQIECASTFSPARIKENLEKLKMGQPLIVQIYHKLTAVKTARVVVPPRFVKTRLPNFPHDLV